MGRGTKITSQLRGRPWLPVQPGAAGISSRNIAAEAGLARGATSRRRSTEDDLASGPLATNGPRNRMDAAPARAEANDRGREVQRDDPLRLRPVRHGFGARHLSDLRARRASEETRAEFGRPVHGVPLGRRRCTAPPSDPAPASCACRRPPRRGRSTGNRNRDSQAHQARLVPAVGHSPEARGRSFEGQIFLDLLINNRSFTSPNFNRGAAALRRRQGRQGFAVNEHPSMTECRETNARGERSCSRRLKT